MYLLECVCLCWIIECALRWGVTHVGGFSLLGIAHPIKGSLFQVQGLFEKMTLFRGRFLEESRVVALMILVYYVLEFLILICVCSKSVIKS